MALARPMAKKGIVLDDVIYPGDILGLGESVTAGAIATVGAGTLTAAAIATGIIYRTGPTGAYTDTTDTAANILTALAGNAWAAEVVTGTTIRLLYVNSVAYAMTLAYGSGVVKGSTNTVVNVAASSVREYLLTILNTSQVCTLNANMTNGSPTFTWSLLPNQQAVPMFGPLAPLITDGATVTAPSGLAAGTTLLNLNMGNGGSLGGTLSNNYTGTTGVVALTFGPTIQIDGLFSATL